MSSMNKSSIRINVSLNTRDSAYRAKAFELSEMRRSCRLLHMDDCYNRYRERLLVTKLALYLLIMELLLAIHVTFICVQPKQPFLNALPFIMVMILLPLMLYVCFFDKSKIAHFSFWNNMASVGAILLVTFVDSFPKFLINPKNHDFAFGSYDHISIMSIYLCLPISYYGRPFILGVLISIWYFFYEFLSSFSIHRTPISEFVDYAIYLLSLNVLMCVFLYNIEYRLRQKILIRRRLLHQNFLLQLAIKRESEMIHAILLPDIADSLQHEIRSRIKDARVGKNILAPRTLFVEIHSDVSILVADMVNFTYLTTQLECKQLVTILHDLFVAFDQAAARNRALRIKFSGDCYVCVVGIPTFNPVHAKFSITMAQDMINETHHLREQCDLEIDMRIGIHSGELFSGIIGSTKWQYDIWSKDVDIAYGLENTGMAGMIHISKSTLNMLDNEYLYEEVTKLPKNNPFIQRLQIKTYLIYPTKSARSTTTFPTHYASSISSVSNLTPNEQFEEIWHNTRNGMIEKVEQMPVGCIQLARIFYFGRRDIPGNEDNLFSPYISSILRLFRTGDNEWNYMNEPDVVMKYTMFVVLYVGAAILANDRLSAYSTKSFTIYFLMAFLVILCLIVWFKHIWLQLIKCLSCSLPTYSLTHWLFALSDIFENQLLARIFVAFSSIFVVYMMATLKTVDCDPNKIKFDLLESAAEKLPDHRGECFEPWEVTEFVILVLALIFFFSGMSLVFKAGLTIFIFASYIIVVKTFHFVWQRVITTNTQLPPEYSGIWYVLEFCIFLLISEQHMTYIDKVDYHSKICYEEKLKRTEISTQSVEIILANILPIHVADAFLTRGHSNELFYEDYTKVAVMFAAIENYQAESIGLRVLNEFICCFDDLLANYMGQFKVEKIKVIDWTYMAASGLQADGIVDQTEQHSKWNNILNRSRSDALYFLTAKVAGLPSRCSFKPRFIHPKIQLNDYCLLTMLQFATEMLKIMEDISQENVYLDFGGSMQGNLKIGISHGPVMAGVVGYSRPHYDIWGHTVNMASRMTSTGVLGSIHVTENTAITLRQLDVNCHYRGMTEVKGVGAIPTYLVALDDAFNFEHFVDESQSKSQTSNLILDMVESEELKEINTQDKSLPEIFEQETQTRRMKHSTKNETKKTEDSSADETEVNPKSDESGGN